MADDVGRLVKKKSLGEKGYLDIQEYPWLDFVEEDILATDNPRKSVVHVRYHTNEEIAQKVRAPQNFARPMGPKSRILVPTDLTEEYSRSQQEIFLRKRKRMLDEDELFNMELADLNGQVSEADGAWSKRGHPSPAAAANEPTKENVSPEKGASSEASSQRESSSREPTPPNAKPTENDEKASSGGVSVAELRAQAHSQGYEAGFAQGLEEGRAQGATKGHEEGLSRGLVEGQREGREQGREEGRMAGYEEGFADGEAKGVAAAEARTERYFSLLAQALAELETLRGEVLRAGQDIFLEIANLCCEKILREKLACNDETLKKLFLSAVDAYADAHRVTLEMNPSDAERMRSAFDAGVQARVVVRENPDLSPGDFRADSEKEILTVDLKRAVEGLIEGLRSELFPEEASGESSGRGSDTSRKTG